MSLTRLNRETEKRGRQVVGAFLGVLGLAIAPVAASQPTAPTINVTVFLGSYDLASDSYSGAVMVRSTPCPEVASNVGLPVSGVKNEADALVKVKTQVAKISQDINQAAAHCAKH
jgi:hypothetical protein